MSKKVILIVAGILGAGAIATGAVFGVMAYNNSRRVATTEPQLDEIAKKVVADYDGKSEIETSKAEIAKIKFSGIDLNEYQVNVKKIMPVTTDNSILEVTFVVMKNTTASSEIKAQITGFKKVVTSMQLEAVLRRINAVSYDEAKKLTTLVKKIDKTMLVFMGLETGYSVNVISVMPKQNDTSIAVITFSVKENNGQISSSNKVLELGGFLKEGTTPMNPEVPMPPTNPMEPMPPMMPPVTPPTNPMDPVTPPSVPKMKTLEELDKITDDIKTLSYKDNKAEVESSKVVKDKIDFGTLEMNIVAEIKKIVVKDGENTTIIVTFVTKQKDGTIESKEKSIEITGFKVPKITKTELDIVLEKIKTVDYLVPKTDVTVKNIENRQLTFKELESGYIVNVISIDHKSGEDTTAVIKFTVSEKDGLIQSSEKTLELTGFKDRLRNLDELDELAKKVTITFKGNPATQRLIDLDKIEIDFANLSDNFEAVDVMKMVKATDPSTLIVKFMIKEKDGTIKSNARTLEISGFKVKAKTADEIAADLTKITKVKYLGDLANTKFSDLIAKLFEVEPLSLHYELIDVSVTQSTSRKWAGYFKFKIREKGERIESAEKTIEFTGFKVEPLTKPELNEFAKKVKGDYKGKENVVIKSIDDIKNLQTASFSFSGFDPLKMKIQIVTADFKGPGSIQLNLIMTDITTNLQSDAFPILVEGFKQS